MNFLIKISIKRKEEGEKKRKKKEQGGEKGREGDREFDCNLFSNKDTTVASKWNSFKGRAPLRRLRPSTVGVGGESNLLPQFSRSEMPRVRVTGWLKRIP